MTQTNSPHVKIIHGDCLTALHCLPAASVDAVVTDPPYAIDAAAIRRQLRARQTDRRHPELSEQSGPSRVTEPARSVNPDTSTLMDAPMLGMRSQNWNDSATHSRGYVDNDPKLFQAWTQAWSQECLRVLKPGGHLLAFGGTPTWHRLTCGIEDAGFVIRGSLAWLYATGFPKGVNVDAAMNGSKSIGSSTRQPTDAANQRWAGWNTALKPAHEPIVLARKPLDGTVAHNVALHGTGALNIDACRVQPSTRQDLALIDTPREDAPPGRWPSDVFLDADAARALNAKAGGRPVADFFWHAKPTGAERVQVDGATHPTVKPLSLMRELIRLVTPPGGVVLDPFAGSGTTVEACLIEGFQSVAVERDATFVSLIQRRVDRRLDPVRATSDRREQPGLFDSL